MLLDIHVRFGLSIDSDNKHNKNPLGQTLKDYENVKMIGRIEIQQEEGLNKNSPIFTKVTSKEFVRRAKETIHGVWDSPSIQPFRSVSDKLNIPITGIKGEFLLRASNNRFVFTKEQERFRIIKEDDGGLEMCDKDAQRDVYVV